MSGCFLPIVAAGPSLSIPGPYWLFTVLHWLTFTLHLIAMNILFGGLLVLVLSGSSPVRKELFTTFTRLFPTVMAATITLGVAPLLFLQVIYGEYFYSASIVSGWNWFLIIPVLIIVYYLLYLVSMSGKLSDRTKVKLLLTAGIGFVYVSYTFTMISDLAEKPHLWAGLYQSSPAGFSINPSFLETIFRWLHIIAGSLAVVGIVVLLFTLYHKKVKGNRDLRRFGARLYMLGVIKAALLGLIYLFTLDGAILNSFMTSSGLHAILGAIVVNIIAVILVYRAIPVERSHSKIWASAVLVFIGLFCMVIGRHMLRLIYLEGQFDAAVLEINPQWGIFGIFFIVFLGGLVTLFWMLRKFFAAGQEIQTTDT